MRSNNPNPAFGSGQEPFIGIPSFMRLPVSRDLNGVDVAIVGIPFDSGTSYRSGTRFGPQKIRESSLMLWGFNRVMNVAPTEILKIVDFGDLPVVPVDIRATMKVITEEVTTILEQDVQVISLGGDHSTSLPLLRAHAKKHGELAVIHIDSHPDTWNEEFEDQPYSHGTPFIRAIEEKLINTEAYIQVGIRGPVSSPSDIPENLALGAKMLPIETVFDLGIPATIAEIIKTIGDRPVYVSLDIDSVDPAFAPGTGTPEVGGLSSFQILQLVRGLKGLNIVGFDLVEVSPPYDHGEITSILAANLVFEFLSLLALRK